MSNTSAAIQALDGKEVIATMSFLNAPENPIEVIGAIRLVTQPNEDPLVMIVIPSAPLLDFFKVSPAPTQVSEYSLPANPEEVAFLLSEMSADRPLRFFFNGLFNAWH